MNNIKAIFHSGVLMTAGILAVCSCTDTWNDHYESAPQVTYDGNAMQAIEKNASDFAKVVKAYGYDRELASENIYTVWAPKNGSFNVNDYVDANGNMNSDSTEVIREFIKNHVTRTAYSLGHENLSFNLMNEKPASMTSDNRFCGVNINTSNISCKNGVLHIIDSVAGYAYNLFEYVGKQYKDDPSQGKDTVSLYAFLYDPKVNSDSLIEDKSVSRGVDDEGNKIWVDSFMLRNNTVLKTVDATLYEEDSSFIAIIPTAKAWAERRAIADKLLNFNPYDQPKFDEAKDSLRNRYANYFAMTDLFFNANMNTHKEDSLMSTLYTGYGKWGDHVYYRTQPKELPTDREVKEILVGEPVHCSNGDAYVVDEYPMSEYEQFFKKIEVTATYNTIDLVETDGKADGYFSKGFNKEASDLRRHYTTYTETWKDSDDVVVARFEKDFGYVDVTPTGAAVNPQIAFEIPNTLSGSYDIFLVTVPYFWSRIDLASQVLLSDTLGYKFKVNLLQRNEGKKTFGSALNMTTPEGSKDFILPGYHYDQDGSLAVCDTTLVGTVELDHAYYNRTEEGVLLQVVTNIKSNEKKKYSREMLISGIYLRPHRDNETAEPEAAKRQSNKKQNIKSIESICRSSINMASQR